MSWFKREDGDLPRGGGPDPSDPADKRVRTEGLWTKCPTCRAVIFKPESTCCSSPAMSWQTEIWLPPIR